MNRRDFISSMMIAMVAAPAVAKSITKCNPWDDVILIGSDIGLRDVSLLQLEAPSRDVLDKIMRYVRISDCRWMSLARAEANGNFHPSSFAGPDGSTWPLRFNERNVYIEPLVTVSGWDKEQSATKFVVNPYWESAKYEVAVSPDVRYPVKYRVDVRDIPEYGYAGRMMRESLDPSASPSAVYFER